jgi:hypothetical protein
MRKIPYCDVVLMLIRKQPGHTSREIAQEAASWRLVWSLLLEFPSAALSLLVQRLDIRMSLVEVGEESVSAACSKGYAQEDSDGTLRITAEGQAWLREKSGL